MGKRGAELKLTPKIQARVVRALKAGCFRVEATRIAGVTNSTFWEWMRLGKDPKARPIFRQFRKAVLEAALAGAANVDGEGLDGAEHEAGRPLLDGRATVVLDTPLLTSAPTA